MRIIFRRIVLLTAALALVACQTVRPPGAPAEGDMFFVKADMTGETFLEDSDYCVRNDRAYVSHVSSGGSPGAIQFSGAGGILGVLAAVVVVTVISESSRPNGYANCMTFEFQYMVASMPDHLRSALSRTSDDTRRAAAIDRFVQSDDMLEVTSLVDALDTATAEAIEQHLAAYPSGILEDWARETLVEARKIPKRITAIRAAGTYETMPLPVIGLSLEEGWLLVSEEEVAAFQGYRARRQACEAERRFGVITFRTDVGQVSGQVVFDDAVSIPLEGRMRGDGTFELFADDALGKMAVIGLVRADDTILAEITPFTDVRSWTCRQSAATTFTETAAPAGVPVEVSESAQTLGQEFRSLQAPPARPQ